MGSNQNSNQSSTQTNQGVSMNSIEFKLVLQQYYSSFVETTGMGNYTDFRKHVEACMRDAVKPMTSRAAMSSSGEGNWRDQLKAQFKGRIESTIGSNQVNIFQDSFRIGEKGNFETLRSTKAEYNTSHFYKVSSIVKDIHEELGDPGCKDEKCKARKRLKEVIKTNKLFVNIFKKVLPKDPNKWRRTAGVVKNRDDINISDENKLYSWFIKEENAEEFLATLKKEVGLFKTEIYKSFVDQLIDGNSDKPEALGTRLFCAVAPVREVIKSTGIFDKKVVGRRRRKRNLSAEEQDEFEEDFIDAATTATGKGEFTVRIGRCQGTDRDMASLKADTARMIVKNATPESESKDKKKGKKKKDKNRKSTLTRDDDFYKFYYVYLGDILELACKNARLGRLDFSAEGDSIYPWPQYVSANEQNRAVDYPLQNARILLGPIEYKDTNGITRKINLAKYPISFKYFRAWFFQKVVRRRRAQMPLGEFISILMDDLVRPSLGAGFPKSIKPKRVRSNMLAMSLPGKQIADRTHKICGKDVLETEEMLPIDRVIDVMDDRFKYGYFKKVKEPRSSESLIKTSYDYLLIYMTSSKDIAERNSDPLQDIREGIYHFNIGSDTGLLKRMSFKRVNITNLAELRSLEAEEQGNSERQLEQLKFPYNTDITLVGTSLFLPGMYFYVNPSLAGLGSVENASSIAYQMNLGGYHLITKISTTIAPGKYETLITGIQTNQPSR